MYRNLQLIHLILLILALETKAFVSSLKFHSDDAQRYNHNKEKSKIRLKKTSLTSKTQKDSTMDESIQNKNSKFQFSIDRGGTFTDIHCILPSGREIVQKLLSEDPDNYPDAPTEGIRRILQEYDNNPNHSYERKQKVYTGNIQSIRMGTTVATNALLERKGERTGLIITKGFKDLLEIGNQSRENIFDLSCYKPSLLYDHVEEVDERVMLGEFVEKSANVDESNINNQSSAEQEQPIRDENKCLSAGATSSPTDTGITNEQIIILRPPQHTQIQTILDQFKVKNIKSLAIVLTHSYTFDKHEHYIASIAKDMDWFTNISMSSQIMPMIKMVSRGHTACAAAYLTPKISTYLDSFKAGFDDALESNVRLSFMKSDGGLTPVDDFGGHQAILSGPAGGVIGYAKTAYRKGGTLLKDMSDNRKDDKHQDGDGMMKANENNDEKEDARMMPVIGFDMGGTSTDVSRYDGSLELVFETITAGVAIQAPQLDINTVAAGGGSRLFLRSGLFYVGPESAGAHPGPVCYRKNGHLAVTDANLVLGRVLPEYFPSIFGPNEDEPLDLEGARRAFDALRSEEEYKEYSVEEIAYGFLKVANEAMCRPIRNLTQMKGYDITTHKLACFGGAGPQHACAMAKALGMSSVFVHRYGGVLSA